MDKLINCKQKRLDFNKLSDAAVLVLISHLSLGLDYTSKASVKTKLIIS